MRTLPPELARAVALVDLDDPSVASITALLEDAGEENVRLSADDVDELTAVRDDLRGVFAERDRDRAAARLNDLLGRHAGPPRLVAHEGWGWHLHVDGADDATWAAWLAASAALALATRLVESTGVPWGVCASDGCDRAFVHDGRGGARHWCSTTCASRERVRRHRAASARR